MNTDSNSIQSIVSLVLKAVALAMGVVVVVMQTLGVAELSTLVTLLGIGMFCLGLEALQSE